MNSKERMEFAVKCADNKKAENIKVLEVSSLTTLADYFIICHGGVANHLKSIADEIEEKFNEQDIKPYSIEGYNTGEWVLMDYSDVIINIFNENTREFYDIEQLWADAPQVDINYLID